MRIFFLSILFFLGIHLCNAQITYTSQQNGDWEDGATWDNGVPTNGPAFGLENIVFIDTPHTVFFTGDGGGFCNFGVEPEIELDNLVIYVAGNLQAQSVSVFCIVFIEDPGDITLTGAGSGIIILNGGFIIEDVPTAGEANSEIIVGGTVVYTATDGTLSGPIILGTPNDPLALPVDLISFDVINNSDDLLAQWTITSEEKNEYYTLEESTDGVSFYAVSEIESQGNTDSYRRYTHPFEAEAYWSEVLYYRLKQTDFNGDFSYSQVVAVVLDPQEGKSLTVYPNPVQNQLGIRNIGFDAKQLRLADKTGRIVYQQDLSDNGLQMDRAINIPEYINSGIYMLQLVHTEGVESKRIVISR